MPGIREKRKAPAYEAPNRLDKHKKSCYREGKRQDSFVFHHNQF